MALKSSTYSHFIPTTGDWYVIGTESLGSGKGARVTMQRVVLWAAQVYSYDDGLQEVLIKGAHPSGYVPSDDHIDHEYVCATDLAPDGRTWGQVYNEAPHFHKTFKVITKVAKSWKYTTD